MAIPAEDSVLQFYEQLAADYHLIFADWQSTMRRQGDVLRNLIVQRVGPGRLAVLDCSSGIGTQAIGLARLDFSVHATDLSPAQVERARREAASLGVSMTFGVADFRTLDLQVSGTFDVVLSCDNSLPHLLTDDDLRRAVHNMYAKLRRGGLLLVSIRDYDQITVARPRGEGPRVFDRPEGRRIVFQVWDWMTDGRAYTLNLFIVQEEGQGTRKWQVTQYATVYRALLRAELDAVLKESGLTGIEWHMPQESGYYQPIATARKA